MQTRLGSFVEAWNNTAVGFFVSWFMWQWIIGPMFHIETNPSESFLITCMFTITSNARQYLLRRFHNWLDHTKTGQRVKSTITLFIVDVLRLTPKQAAGGFCALIILIVLGAQYA